MAETKKDVKKTTAKKTTTSKTKDIKVEENAKEKVDNEDVIALLMKQIADLQKQIGQNNKIEKTEKSIEKETPKKITTNKKATFQDIRNEEIAVKRVVGGIGLVMYKDKKTGDEYVWREVGDVEYVLGDALKRMSPNFLKTPWLKIIDNDDAIDALNLRDLYDDIELIEDIDKLIDVEDFKIESIINKLSKEYKQVLATNIISKISSGALSNVNIIRRFERLLGKEFLV